MSTRLIFDNRVMSIFRRLIGRKPLLFLIVCSLYGCAGREESPAVKMERARILMDRDRAAEAVPLLTEVLTEYPQNADASYLRGLAYERLNVLERPWQITRPA